MPERITTYAPAQRGYSPGARPRSRWAYAAKELAADVAALIDAVGSPVHLVGHDWSATAARATSTRYPDLVRSLTVVSVGHPRRRTSPRWPARQTRSLPASKGSPASRGGSERSTSASAREASSRTTDTRVR